MTANRLWWKMLEESRWTKSERQRGGVHSGSSTDGRTWQIPVCHFLVVLFPSQASWVVSAPVISTLSPWIQADAQLSQPGQVLVLQVLEVLKGEVRSFMAGTIHMSHPLDSKFMLEGNSVVEHMPSMRNNWSSISSPTNTNQWNQPKTWVFLSKQFHS